MRHLFGALTLVALSWGWAEASVITLSPGHRSLVINSERLPRPIYAVTILGEKDGMLDFELRPADRTMHPHLKLSDSDGGNQSEAWADEDGKVTRMTLPIGTQPLCAGDC
jgi:hypothetical protein